MKSRGVGIETARVSRQREPAAARRDRSARDAAGAARSRVASDRHPAAGCAAVIESADPGCLPGYPGAVTNPAARERTTNPPPETNSPEGSLSDEALREVTGAGGSDTPKPPPHLSPPPPEDDPSDDDWARLRQAAWKEWQASQTSE